MNMTSRTIRRIISFSAAAALLWIGTVIAQEKEAVTADRHKARGLACDACHSEAQPKAPATAKACLTCHQSLTAVAERTKDFDKNPHNNHLTESSEIECTQCHHGHTADTPVCHQCHEGMKFEKKQAAMK
jgi:fumarate reductase flavoprotein subunit